MPWGNIFKFGTNIQLDSKMTGIEFGGLSSRSLLPHKANILPCECNISGMPWGNSFTLGTNIHFNLDFIMVAKGQRSRSWWLRKVCLCYSWTCYLKISLRECLKMWYIVHLGLKDKLITCCCLQAKGHSDLMFLSMWYIGLPVRNFNYIWHNSLGLMDDLITICWSKVTLTSNTFSLMNVTSQRNSYKFGTHFPWD